MLGALGMIVPELLDGTDHVPWFDAGAKIFSSKGIQYLGVPGLINARNIVATLLVQVTFVHKEKISFCIDPNLEIGKRICKRAEQPAYFYELICSFVADLCCSILLFVRKRRRLYPGTTNPPSSL